MRRTEALRKEINFEGKQHFDEFRAKIARIEQEAGNSLDILSDDVRRAEFIAGLALWVGTGLTLLICVGMGVAVNRVLVLPLLQLADVMRRLADRDTSVEVPGTTYRNEVGEMARAVTVFKDNMVELDRTTLLRAIADILPALVGYVDAKRRVRFLNEEFGRWFELTVGDVAQVYGRSMS